MSKISWPPGTMLFPAPAVLVSCGDKPSNYNLITLAWAGNICSDPAMTFVSIRPERHSHSLIKKSRELVINLTTVKLAFAVDFCGVKSGRDINKWERLKLTAEPASKVSAPLLKESPVNIECRVKEIKPLGSHDMFICDVLGIQVDQSLLNKKGAFDLRSAEPIAYSHGHYYALGKHLGSFGFSVKKK